MIILNKRRDLLPTLLINIFSLYFGSFMPELWRRDKTRETSRCCTAEDMALLQFRRFTFSFHQIIFLRIVLSTAESLIHGKTGEHKISKRLAGILINTPSAAPPG